MSYLALARKYRPQTFEGVAAQDFVTATLQNAINMGRVSHAYLFTGPRGVGKTSTARIFAKALNCLNPKGAVPCGQCENCVEIAAGTSLDVMEIDGASNRGVDEIRALRESVKFVPIKSPRKIYIVDEVHMLTKEAFNALLKTLEEPPEFVLFIFATTDPHKLPATIISRCQRYEFRKIPYAEMLQNIVNILKAENVEYEEDALGLIIRNSEGCMRDALSILDQVIAYSDGKVDARNTAYLLGVSDKYLADEIFAAVLRERPDDLPSIIEKIDERGMDLKFVTGCLIEHTRNMLFLVSTGSLPSKDTTASEADFYEGLKKHATDRRLYALFQIFQRTLNDIKYCDFARYVFEFAMFKGASVSQIISVSSPEAAAVPRRAAKNVPLVQLPQIEAPAGEGADKKERESFGEKAERTAFLSQSPEEGKVLEKMEKVRTPDPKGFWDNVTEPAPGAVTSEDLWKKALKIIADKGGPLDSHLRHGFLVSALPEKITVGFPEDRSFQYNFFTKPQNRERVQAVLSSLAKPAPRFEAVLSGGEGLKKKAPVETAMRADSYRERQIKKAVRDDPLIKAAAEQLGAQIESIDILIDLKTKEE